MLSTVFVFLGGGIGAVLRHGVNLAAIRLLGIQFPYGTFMVNTLGSFTMGLLAGLFLLKGEANPAWRLFLLTGILGGFTTFSAFSMDAVMLYERGQVALSLFYVLASVTLSIIVFASGLFLVRQWL